MVTLQKFCSDIRKNLLSADQIETILEANPHLDLNETADWFEGGYEGTSLNPKYPDGVPGTSVPSMFLGKMTPLMIAVSYGFADTVDALLELGADPNIPNGTGDYNPLDCLGAHIYSGDPANKARIELALTKKGAIHNPKQPKEDSIAGFFHGLGARMLYGIDVTTRTITPECLLSTFYVAMVASASGNPLMTVATTAAHCAKSVVDTAVKDGSLSATTATTTVSALAKHATTTFPQHKPLIDAAKRGWFFDDKTARADSLDDASDRTDATPSPAEAPYEDDLYDDVDSRIKASSPDKAHGGAGASPAEIVAEDDLYDAQPVVRHKSSSSTTSTKFFIAASTKTPTPKGTGSKITSTSLRR